MTSSLEKCYAHNTEFGIKYAHKVCIQTLAPKLNKEESKQINK
jgi:hypothetical protein